MGTGVANSEEGEGSNDSVADGDFVGEGETDVGGVPETEAVGLRI